MRFRAVLFDLDGTLIHTTHLYREACTHALHSMGLRFTQEDFDRLYPTGSGFRDWLIDLGGKEESLTLARETRDRFYENLLRERSEFLDGAEELLGSLQHHPSAIITGSWRSYVDAIDEKLKISNYIPLIITANETDPYHKPHPHGLFLAADALDVDPKNCVYIGDQAFDLEAAKAAGMASFFIRGPHSPKGAEEKADIVISHLSELSSVL